MVEGGGKNVRTALPFAWHVLCSVTMACTIVLVGAGDRASFSRSEAARYTILAAAALPSAILGTGRSKPRSTEPAMMTTQPYGTCVWRRQGSCSRPCGWPGGMGEGGDASSST